MPPKAFKLGYTVLGGPDEGGDRPWIRLSVAGVSTTALVDTGATRTLVSKSYFSRLPRHYELQPAYCKLYSATGNRLSVVGETLLPIGKRHVLRAVVVEDLDDAPVIIGSDALRQAGSVINYESKTVDIAGVIYNIITDVQAERKIWNVSQLPPVTDTALKQVLEEYKDVFGAPGTLGECTLQGVSVNTGVLMVSQRS